ncbi:MAG TPA: BrnT family toxin [Urbifossiella sp.]|nr:BrnT family toxin [Urbifossiella sp.]
MDFEWDDDKAASNETKHGVPFTEAVTVFGDPLALTGYDPAHSDDEDRYITMGQSEGGRLLIVSHTDRGDKVRIISARVASRAERKDYEDGYFP